MTDAEQLIAQARAIHAKAMNCSDFAQEGAWVARETVNGLPPNNYWAVMAKRTPTTKGVEPFTVWKAHVREPAMAGLLTFISTALPQLCDLAEKALASPLPLPEPGEGNAAQSLPSGLDASRRSSSLDAEPAAAAEPSVGEIPDTELLRRAVRAMGPGRRRDPRWVIVMDRFSLGSTFSRELCRRFGFDPDEKARR